MAVLFTQSEIVAIAQARKAREMLVEADRLESGAERDF
jgi:hypothetical protein